MGEFGDAMKAFRSAFKPGPTEPGAWRYLEQYGRFTGTGEVSAELELPEGPVAISSEDYEPVDDLEFDLTGPGGEEIEVKRYSPESFSDLDRGAHHLFRIATGEIPTGGLHRLRVKSPDPDQPLLIAVGEELRAGVVIGDFAKQMIPGAKLWKRLRGGD